MSEHPAKDPVQIAAAWKAAEMRKASRWIHVLSDAELAELDAALERVRGKEIFAIGKQDFPLPSLAQTLGSARRELEEGTGVMLIRGLPVERWGETDSMKAYWGLSLHLGQVTAQNGKGQLLGHVRAAGKDWDKDNSARGYQTTSFLPYHCDKGDIVGLLCLQTAKSGGESCVASSVAVHNAVLERRPDLVEALYSDLYVDLRDEQPAGLKPYYLSPYYHWHNNRLYGRYGRKYIESGQRFPELPRLTPKQIEMMEYVEQLASSDEFRLDMNFAPGDVQYLNNHVIVHSRNDYVDHPEPERWRHLVRIILFSEAYRDIPEHLHHLNKVTLLWGEQAGTIGNDGD